MTVEDEKRVAAEAAAEMVEYGMTVGLGSGSTVAHLLPALVRRDLSLRCVVTSVRTEEAARECGLRVERLTAIERLDLCIDGADQIAPDGLSGRRMLHIREQHTMGFQAVLNLGEDSS